MAAPADEAVDVDLSDITPPKVVVPRGERPSEIPLQRAAAGVVSDGYILCTSDHHYPIQDRIAEAAIIRLAQDVRPRTWVFNGDILDCWWISRHEKEAERLFAADAGNRIVDEVDAARGIVSEAALIADTVYLGQGNHERRLSALINSNPGLHGLPALSWPAIWNLPGNVVHLDYGYELELGPVTFVHGDTVGGRSRFGVKHVSAWVLDNWGTRTSWVFGHWHRQEMKSRTIWEQGQPVDIVAIAQGHLSDARRQLYVTKPNWQTGFVLLEVFTVAGKMRFTPHIIQVIDGRFSWGGRVYDGRRV
jgi:hypothetical protein